MEDLLELSTRVPQSSWSQYTYIDQSHWKDEYKAYYRTTAIKEGVTLRYLFGNNSRALPHSKEDVCKVIPFVSTVLS